MQDAPAGAPTPARRNRRGRRTAQVGATHYPVVTGALRDCFETRPRFGPEEQNLVVTLHALALAWPDSLDGQLAFIRERWRDLIGELLERLLTGLDVL